MEKGDYAEVGKLVYATHEGLSKEYGVSCPELDFIRISTYFSREDMKIVRPSKLCSSEATSAM